MLEWLFQYWVEALFGGLIALLGLGYRQLAKQGKRWGAVGGGVQALLRDRIIQAYNHYTDKGFCPIYAMENVEAMYKQYHALGGNGTITELVERLKEMPTEPRKEEEDGE